MTFNFNRRGVAAGLAAIAGAVPAWRRGAAQEAGGSAPAPGAPTSLESQALGAGSVLLQSTPPVEALNVYLNGFHAYADDRGRQVEASHFCMHLSEDFMQCVIFDGNTDGSRLIGIEYIISERLFLGLDDEEKGLWHSHRHEVKSGQLVGPGLPDVAELEVVEKVASTYGKTWHTWQVDRGDPLPLGIPQLMMSFTADGQIDEAILRERDRRLGISSDEKRRDREGIVAPEPHRGADLWRSGRTPQLQRASVDVRGR